MKNVTLLGFAMMLAALLSCGIKTAAGEEKKPEAAGETKPLSFGKDDKRFTMQVPMNWKEEEPSNNMRMLQVRIPKAKDDPDDAEISAFKMGAAGGADANIARWAKQFGGDGALKTKRALKTGVGDATIAELEGDYTAMNFQAGGASEVKKDYKMIGAIITMDGGAEIYFKFTGPFNTIEKAKAAFDKVLESLKPEKSDK